MPLQVTRPVNRRRSVLLAALVAIAASGLVACSSGDGAAPAARLGAAEPSVAPTPSGEPRGETVAVGADPEGIVYDPVTKLLAVGVRDPDRLVLVDTTTMTVTREIPIKGHVRHLQLAAPGGPVLVPEEDANTLEVVSLPDGAMTGYPVGVAPHDATAVDGGYVAGDEFGRSFTTVLDGIPKTYREVDQPGGVIGFGDVFALVDVFAFSVSTWNVADGREIASLPAGAGPTHGVRVGENKLVVTDTRGGHLITFSVSPLRQLSSVQLPGGPYGITADPSAPVVWVTLTADNLVVGFDVSGDTPRELERLTTVGQPNTVAADGRDVWVTGTREGVVQHLTRFTS
ncbi:YncE family protein [Jatrophihabitans sp. YIM 134969]